MEADIGKWMDDDDKAGFGGLFSGAIRVLEFDKVRAALAQKCVSAIGRQYADELAPSIYEAEIRRDMAQTSDAEHFIIRNGTPPIGGFADIRGALKRVELDATLNQAELLQVASVLRSVRNMKRFGKSAGAGASTGASANNLAGASTGANAGILTGAEEAAFPLTTPDGVQPMISSLTENQRLENHINECIISEEEIADNASPALLSIRRQIKRMQDSIKEKLDAILRSPAYQKFMQDSLVTMRGDRYVIPVKQEHRSEIKGLVHDMSSSGATVFVEPMAVVEANNEIRELKVKEEIEIERILAELTSEVAEIRADLVKNVETLGLLDFLFAKAKLSLDYDCTAPKIGAAEKINIKRGRHPLLARDSVVPTDFWMSADVNTVIITGPNTGGKTVALKTVGLFTLMAQAGLHIPADSGSSLCVFKKVFADIGDEQSIEQSLSTFSSHMRNIVNIMKEADDSTLALFDEIGAGTDPTEGAAIATAVLECLHQTGTASVATTHYSELKLYALTTPGVENACCEFDIATLRPTYKLLIGIPGKSNAFAISGRLGLAPEILARAREFLTNESVQFEDVLQTIGKNREEAEQERRAAQRARIEAEELRGEVARQNASIEKQREAVLKEAREKARGILTEARYEAEEFLKKLKEIEDEQDAAQRRKGAQMLRGRMKSKLDSVESALSFTLPPREGYVRPPENLKPGDTVEIVNLRQRGIVQTPPDGNGNALIRAGIMSITAHVSNIKLIDEQGAISRSAADALRVSGADTLRAYGTGDGRTDGIGGAGGGSGGGAAGGGMAPRSLNIRAELDVRGTRLEGAIQQVDRYLEDASAAGLNEVSVIHGKGTGALRSGIQDFLRRHPRAKSFRNGNYGEGDMGVTVITLK